MEILWMVSFGLHRNLHCSSLVPVQPGDDVRCADCNVKGIIGQTLIGKRNGTIPGTTVKRVDYKCDSCSKKMPIDKQQKEKYPF